MPSRVARSATGRQLSTDITVTARRRSSLVCHGKPVLYGVDDYVQGERGAVEHTGLDVADCDGLGARAERLPQDFVGGGQHGQVAMQVNDVVRTGEPDLHLHALLEGVSPPTTSKSRAT